jgi:hypothetical protein
MIDDFLKTAHPDTVQMGAASKVHGRLYVEHFQSGVRGTYAFRASKGRKKESDAEEQVFGVEFTRDASRRRRHAFDPGAFAIGVPRVPVEFEADEPARSPSMVHGLTQ